MNKKQIFTIVLWFVVACFFYAAIWTNDKNTVSDCWMLTGFVAIGQLMFTGMSYAIFE